MATASGQNQHHLQYLAQALDLARQSPPKPTNFRVGCVIVSSSSPGNGHVKSHVVATGYTLELPGNTHAEQNALAKLISQHRGEVSESPSSDHLAALGGLGGRLSPSAHAVLYTTLEPCGKRLSGSLPCVERIILTRRDEPSGGIRKVVFGAREPDTFVQDSQSLRRLDDAGVAWEFVPGLEPEILKVAMEGHAKASDATQAQTAHAQGTNVDDISPQERRRQEQLPRNPKKRMMEVDFTR